MGNFVKFNKISALDEVFAPARGVDENDRVVFLLLDLVRCN